MLPGSSRIAFRAAGEKRREYSGEAVARLFGRGRCGRGEGGTWGGALGVAGLFSAMDGIVWSESGFRGSPANASGAVNLEKTFSKTL